MTLTTSNKYGDGVPASIRNFIRCAMIIAAVAFVNPYRAEAADPDPAEMQNKQIEILKSDSKPGDKGVACKLLAIYGTKDAIPVLAPLLADAELASWARIALEAIPDPAADDALRKAMGTLKGRLLVGTINSIGVRRDAKAADGLIKLLKDADSDVACAAAVALGHIGGDAAAKALVSQLASAVPEVVPEIATGCILCAEKLLDEGNLKAAEKIYDTVRNAKVSKQKIMEATRGVILARQDDGVKMLAELLKSEDKGMFGLGLSTARELPGRGVAKVLLKEFDRAEPGRKSYLLMAMNDRGDKEAMQLALDAAKEGPKVLRLTAIEVLNRMGEGSAVPVLLSVSADSDEDIASAAKDALTVVSGEKVDETIISMLKDPAVKVRLLAIDLLIRRQYSGALQLMLKTAGDSDEEVRIASLKALSSLAGMTELQKMLDLLVNGQTKNEIRAAESAVSAICTRSSTESGGSVVIVKAVYGDLVGNKLADVTSKVAEMIKAGSMDVEASNSNFGDPAGGRVKQLRIDYTVEGRAQSKTVSEGETITISASTVNPACTEAVLAAMKKAPVDPKLALLRILRTIGSGKALVGVREAAGDANTEISETALRALFDWPNADALPDLAALARTASKPTFKILALRGYIRLIDLKDGAPAERLELIKDAMSLTERTDEMRLVLGALCNVQTVDALALVVPHLDKPELKEEASAAVVAIAEKIRKPYPASVTEALDKVTKVSANEKTVESAKALLNK